MKPSRAFLAFLLCPLLFWSCASRQEEERLVDPVAALSYSSEGAAPVAFAVIPSSFILPALEELKMSESEGEDAPAADFLEEFFTRAECVFASIMYNSEGEALFCRAIAFGKFPARSFRLLLSASRGWESKEADGAAWFESSDYGERTIRAAIPASGVLLAEIDIAAPSDSGETGGASRSMADLIAAATAAPAAPQSYEQGDGGAGDAFFSAVDAALLGAANVPFAFYAPDFNLFARSVLPAVPDFPLAGVAAALASFEGFSLPISSIEFAVSESAAPAEDEARTELLTVRAAVPSAALMRAAAFIVQLMFPDDSVTAENGLITVAKEAPAGRAALAVLSFFLVS